VPSGVKQKAIDSECTNILALAGNVNVNCSALTPKQQKIIEGIPSILHRILKNQLDPTAVTKKLDEIQEHLGEIQKQETFSGLLTPSDEPTPPNACSEFIPSGAMLVMLGNSASFDLKYPFTVIKIGDERMLVVDRVGEQIAISAKLFSEDGRIVAQLDKNRFFINPNNYFRKEISADGHSLVIYDQKDIEVLNVKFLNATTIEFLGLIRYPGVNLEISKERGRFSGSACFAMNGEADFYIGAPSTPHP
jgi:hypothetical protein